MNPSPELPHLIYLALGSNLGPREALLNNAVHLLGEQVGEVLRVAPYITTAPVGFKSEHAFLNTVALLRTAQSPIEVLRATQAIERQLGRQHKSVNGVYTDRLIDIDLLLYDDLIYQSDPLTLPHPHLHERRFVLEPLHYLAPQLRIPATELTVEAWLQRLNQAHIEEATLSHCTSAVLEQLNGLLPQLSTSAAPRSLEALTALVQSAHTHLHLLNDETGTICGMATLTLTPLPTGLKAWIDDVVISQPCRGRGYGGQLIDHLINRARQLQATSLNLTSRPTREAANRLYQRKGFELRTTNVYQMKL